MKDAEDAVYYLHKKEFMGEIVSCFVILESASLLNSHKCSITCYLCYDLYHAVTIVQEMGMRIEDIFIHIWEFLAGMRIRFWPKTGSGTLHFKLREILLNEYFK